MPLLPHLLLPTLLIILAIDCLIEVGLLGSMVSYLHISHHDVPFAIAATSSTPSFSLFPKPAHLSVNQGHTSNGAAGTALILVSLLGFLVLLAQKRARALTTRHSTAYTQVRSTNDGAGNTHTRKERHLPSSFAWLEPTWVVFTVLSWLLTLSALIYTFVVTKQTQGSRIKSDLAAATYAARTGPLFPYPGDKWTPETWYKQVLTLDFVDGQEKGDIRTHVRLIEAWRWNLIPLLILGGAVMLLALSGWLERRREAGPAGRSFVREKHVSTVSEL